MAIATLSDAELVSRCRQGDEEAWGALVERYSGYVYAILSRGFRMPEHAAEDVFQEVFARLFERIDELRDDTAVRPWIAQTARRLAIDRFRSAGREGPTPSGELPERAELDAQLETLDDAIDVRAGLDEVSGPCREVLTRFFIRDESYATIGEAMEIPPGTIASRISRCLGKLREVLEGSGAGPRASGVTEGA